MEINCFGIGIVGKNVNKISMEIKEDNIVNFEKPFNCENYMLILTDNYNQKKIIMNGEEVKTNFYGKIYMDVSLRDLFTKEYLICSYNIGGDRDKIYHEDLDNIEYNDSHVIIKDYINYEKFITSLKKIFTKDKLKGSMFYIDQYDNYHYCVIDCQVFAFDLKACYYC